MSLVTKQEPTCSDYWKSSLPSNVRAIFYLLGYEQMPNIKKYIIDYDWKASIEIEIDHDVMTEEKLHQINNFWSDS
ncbi:DUF2528 family protein, partial [Escherichia albertii]